MSAMAGDSKALADRVNLLLEVAEFLISTQRFASGGQYTTAVRLRGQLLAAINADDDEPE